MEVFLLTGFLLGLASNFHCLGMCGPIAIAIPLNRTNNWTMLSGALQYNFGRVITYMLLGALVGTFGVTIQTLGILQWISIVAGIGLILFAWRKYLHHLFPRISTSFNTNRFLSPLLGKLFRSQSKLKLVALGGLNGLLPCGMVYAGLLNAILTGDFLYSSSAMGAFGIGTLPAMLAVTFVANKINSTARIRFGKIAPYVLTIVGLLIVLRGMNLNIPYISPKISNKAMASESQKETEVEMSCCHKKTTCD